MTNESQLFIEAYQRRLLCIHPTDSLWGLTCDMEWARHRLFSFKGHSNKRKGFVHLVANTDDALRLWQPLPGKWAEILDRLWPAPLTVVWQGRTSCVEDDGTLALRVPSLSSSHLWFRDCLVELAPLISTSVNVSGQPPMSSQEISKNLANDPRFYLPSAINKESEQLNKASTVIAIAKDGKFKVLRLGAFDPALVTL